MKHIRTKMLLKEIAKNEEVTQEDVIKIVELVLGEYPRYIMSSCVERETNEFPNIRIPNFGIFYVSSKKKGYLAKLNKKDESI